MLITSIEVLAEARWAKLTSQSYTLWKSGSFIVKCESVYDKTIHIRDPKKKYKRNVKLEQTVLTVKNDCVLVTNLLDDELYSDAHCLELYKSRWDVEVFFKLVKETYKFSYLTENDSDANNKATAFSQLIVKWAMLTSR